MQNKPSLRQLAIFTVIALASVHASAITIAELSKKNSEAVEADLEIALAKKKQELASLKPQPSASVSNAPPVRTKKETPVDELAGVTLTEIFGDITNSVARFDVNGARFSRKRGDTLYSWQIESVKADQVVLSRPLKGKAPIQKTIYLSAAPASAAMPAGRDALRAVPGIQPGMPITPIPVTPMKQ